MSETLNPNGTASCDWIGRTPTQADGNCHLNVNEGMAAKSATEKIETNAIGHVFGLLFPQTTITGTIERIDAPLYFAGVNNDNIPGVSMQWFLDSVAITTAKSTRWSTSDTATTGMETWQGSDITHAALTGEVWNAASFRELRITTLDAGVVTDTPGPWIEEAD